MYTFLEVFVTLFLLQVCHGYTPSRCHASQTDENRLVCISGRLFERPCPYEPYVHIGSCRHRDGWTCPTQTGKFKHPSYTDQYYSCTGYIPTLHHCPYNQQFNGINCVDKTVSCPTYGYRLIKDPQSNHKYYQCINGVATHTSCPAGYLFDERRQTCIKSKRYTTQATCEIRYIYDDYNGYTIKDTWDDMVKTWRRSFIPGSQPVYGLPGLPGMPGPPAHDYDLSSAREPPSSEIPKLPDSLMPTLNTPTTEVDSNEQTTTETSNSQQNSVTTGATTDANEEESSEENDY